MSQEKAALLMFKGLMADLPEDDKAKVEAAKAAIELLVEGRGEHGTLALQWLAIEMAAEA